MLGALVLCSLSEHVFCCALLTLQCACVNEWHALCEASKEPCSAVPRWSHKAYCRNLSGVYTDLPMPRGTQCLLRELTRNGQSMWTELSFLSQTFQSLWPFHNSLGIRSTNLIYRRRQWHPTPVLLPGKSHGWRSLVGCSPWGRWGSDTTEQLDFHFLLSCIGEGNGNPLQCSCLENPGDGGAWRAAIWGVAQSRT